MNKVKSLLAIILFCIVFTAPTTVFASEWGEDLIEDGNDLPEIPEVPSGDSGNNPIDSGDPITTDEWIKDWDYELDETNKYIMLKKYCGPNPLAATGTSDEILNWETAVKKYPWELWKSDSSQFNSIYCDENTYGTLDITVPASATINGNVYATYMVIDFDSSRNPLTELRSVIATDFEPFRSANATISLGVITVSFRVHDAFVPG